MVFVLDTSVLLSDPKALERLSDKDIVIPLVVLTELEAKRNHPELGFAAREALRTLEKYRSSGSILDLRQTSSNGTIRVEINNIFDSNLPEAFQTDLNDHRILAVASNLAKTQEVTLLTKDLPLRLKASISGVNADDYTPDKLLNEWTGVMTISLELGDFERLMEYDFVPIEDTGLTDIPANTGLIIKCGTSSTLGRRIGNHINRVRTRGVFDINARSAEQHFALDLLTDDSVGIVSVGGPAGTGKSILALAAGLDSVIERRQHKKVIVFRPLYAVGGQDLGFLPGTAEEKMSPWAAAVFDALEVFCGPHVMDEVIENDLIEVLPLTHIRGRTLTDAYVIVDEAQNLEKMVLLTALSRIGKNSKVVLTHDVAQRDNLRVGKHDGINSVINSLAGEALFAHCSLVRSERSPVAELVSRLLEV